MNDTPKIEGSNGRDSYGNDIWDRIRDGIRDCIRDGYTDSKAMGGKYFEIMPINFVSHKNAFLDPRIKPKAQNWFRTRAVMKLTITTTFIDNNKNNQMLYFIYNCLI